jgi:hypothetical protein
MRKLLLSLVCLLFATGIVMAAEVTLVGYDGETKALTVKEGEKEITYKINDKTKVTFIDQDGKSTDGTLEAAAKVLSKDKAKGKLKFELIADKDSNVTELKMKGKKAK